MTVAMTPCPSCARHVRLEAAECPFCGSLRAATSRPPLGSVSETITFVPRSVMFVLGASLAMSGCESARVPIYGGPAPSIDGDENPGDAAVDVDSGESHDADAGTRGDRDE
jgi:hypothetical protein